MILDITAGNHRTEREIDYVADICCDANPRDNRTIKAVWSKLPVQSSSVDLLIYDPPHQVYGHGLNSWMVSRYSSFENGTMAQSLLEQAFTEIRRVLKPEGSCLFKWSTNHKPLEWVVGLSRMQSHILVERPSLSASPDKPFSHKATVYWVELT